MTRADAIERLSLVWALWDRRFAPWESALREQSIQTKNEVILAISTPSVIQVVEGKQKREEEVATSAGEVLRMIDRKGTAWLERNHREYANLYAMARMDVGISLSDSVRLAIREGKV